jgi:ABC-type uncharacterized transport system substrate-binding protein
LLSHETSAQTVAWMGFERLPFYFGRELLKATKVVAVDHLVPGLARPTANVTGINWVSGELVAKRLELLRELVPGAARVAMLTNPADVAATQTTSRDMEAAARVMGLQIQILNASTSREINAVFAAFARERPDALFVAADPFFFSRRMQLTHLASRHALPATYSTRDFAEAGGLMTYGANIVEAYRQMGVYAGRILKGTKPADLPPFGFFDLIQCRERPDT